MQRTEIQRHAAQSSFSQQRMASFGLRSRLAKSRLSLVLSFAAKERTIGINRKPGEPGFLSMTKMYVPNQKFS
jgi:hypothetical protein